MPDAKRFLLVWLDHRRSIDRATISPIRRDIEDQVAGPPDEVEIDLWLESPGGDAHAAYKLAVLLRSVASTVRVVVPDYAKSAATLLALVGDEIYLAPSADMGPLDAQMPDEGSFTGSISALNIARAADEVARDAVDMAVSGGADLLDITGLSRAQTIDAMLRFSAAFSEPLVRQLDPKVVHHAKQMLKVTAQYAQRLLDDAGNPNPEGIARSLVETFPTHGYAITRSEAFDLGLPVHPLEEYEFADKVREGHRAAEAGLGQIKFCSLDSFIDPPDETKTTPRSRKGGRTNGKTQEANGADPATDAAKVGA